MKIKLSLIFFFGVQSIASGQSISPEFSPSIFKNELKNILTYWQKNAQDTIQGGFWGVVDVNNTPNQQANKGLILNCRITWTFAAAASTLKNEKSYPVLAKRGYEYLDKYFWDKKNGGGFWSVRYDGKPDDMHKQVYAQGFLIYSLAEYYKISKNKEALEKAKNLYNILKNKCKDPVYGGFYESFSSDWKPINDNTITEGKPNQTKSMNTHLHLIEAFANLYQIWPNPSLKQEIIHLLEIFDQKIIPNHKTQILFFNDQWSSQSEAISFGHDIESAWLLLETAKILNEPFWINKMKKLAINLAVESVKGLDFEDGGMYNETNLGKINTQKHWWPQAEAMVGFYNAFELTNDTTFLKLSINSWKFIEKKIKSPSGEWYWGLNERNEQMIEQGKIGPWKGPYHNGRACMEMIKRISNR